ncbi:hypothetical protein RJJ65_39985, partial [Rhizobium hidalgonense]
YFESRQSWKISYFKKRELDVRAARTIYKVHYASRHLQRMGHLKYLKPPLKCLTVALTMLQ